VGNVWKKALGATIFIVCLNASAQRDDGTLYSGLFDDYLMVVADHETKNLSGYYNDGKCRFYFKGLLQSAELYQRKDFGEAYIVNTWIPNEPGNTLSSEIYSIAKGGFRRQITIETTWSKKTKFCRERISLDMAYNVGNTFTEVRVIRKKSVPLYQIKKTGQEFKLVRDHQRIPPTKDMGVWISKTYSAEYSPKGYVYINWHGAKGEPFAAYVHERYLYPIF